MKITRVGIIGYGSLGQFLHSQLSSLPSFEVIRIWNRTADSTKGILPLENIDEQHLGDIDLVVEVAHPLILKKYAEVILKYTNLLIGSPTCLADEVLFQSINNILSEHKERSVFVPAGAFWGGNDIQKMADKGTLKVLTVTMTKHPNSFKLESPLKEINEEAKKESEKETVLYEGSVRGLCPVAPNNVNTMAGAAIAGHNLGFDGVKAKLISDPKMSDWHIVEVCVEGPDGFQVNTIRKNPAKPGAITGQLTYYSFLASIKEAQFKPPGLHIC